MYDLEVEQEALAIAREARDRNLEGVVLGNLGALHREPGRMEEAREHYELALAIHRETGNRRHEGVLPDLGSLQRDQGRTAEAAALLAEGERLLRDVDDRIGLGKLLCDRGELEIRTGRFAAARATLAEAEPLAAAAGAGPDSDLGRKLDIFRGNRLAWLDVATPSGAVPLRRTSSSIAECGGV